MTKLTGLFVIGFLIGLTKLFSSADISELTISFIGFSISADGLISFNGFSVSASL